MPDRPSLVEFPAPGSAVELKEFVGEILEEIEAGELVAVAVVKIGVDGSTCAGWAFDRGVDSARIIGGAALLTHRLLLQLDVDAEQIE